MSKLRKKIAIVGEGVTEWCYFDGFKRFKRYPFALEPQLPCSSNWRGVLKRAELLSDKPYDAIYCVLDYDTIINQQSEYDKFVKEQTRLRNKKKTRKISYILSMPCIEYWFLLHFKENVSTKEYLTYSELEPELRKVLPGYEKKKKYFSKCNFYKMISCDQKEEKAIRSAERLDILRADSDSKTFPFTEVYKLLSELSDVSQKFV